MNVDEISSPSHLPLEVSFWVSVWLSSFKLSFWVSICYSSLNTKSQQHWKLHKPIQTSPQRHRRTGFMKVSKKTISFRITPMEEIQSPLISIPSNYQLCRTCRICPAQFWNVRQRVQAPPDILSGNDLCGGNVQQGNQRLPDIFRWKNVRQGIKMSCRGLNVCCHPLPPPKKKTFWDFEAR